jgi:hypothetical protein
MYRRMLAWVSGFEAAKDSRYANCSLKYVSVGAGSFTQYSEISRLEEAFLLTRIILEKTYPTQLHDSDNH